MADTSKNQKEKQKSSKTAKHSVDINKEKEGIYYIIKLFNDLDMRIFVFATNLPKKFKFYYGKRLLDASTEIADLLAIVYSTRNTKTAVEKINRIDVLIERIRYNTLFIKEHKILNYTPCSKLLRFVDEFGRKIGLMKKYFQEQTKMCVSIETQK